MVVSPGCNAGLICASGDEVNGEKATGLRGALSTVAELPQWESRTMWAALRWALRPTSGSLETKPQKSSCRCDQAANADTTLLTRYRADRARRGSYWFAS